MTPDSPAELSKPVPAPQASIANPPIRLARLRQEFAELYAGLDAGTWYPAASLADYFRAWLTRHPDRRGGTPREPPWLPGASADERRSPTAG